MIPLISCIDLDSTFVHTTRNPDAFLHKILRTNPQTGSRTYMTTEQEKLYELIDQSGTIIPITGRSSESIQELGIPFEGYKIVCHGGLILDANNEEVLAWKEISTGPGQEEILQAILSYWQSVIRSKGLPARVWMVAEFGRSIYVSLKGSPEILNSLALDLQGANLLPDTYMIHYNHRNMAVLPPFVRKEKALSWLREQFFPEKALWLGFGDSNSDLPYMQACDFWITPSGSQIEASLG